MAGGNFGGGDGNAVTPYLVEDAADLNAVRNGLGKAYKQVANINLSAYTNWTPIGNSTNRFSGIYDGGNYTVSNLFITSSVSHLGLFGYSTGELIGINVVSGKITFGQPYVGAVVAYSSGTVKSCSNQGVILEQPVSKMHTNIGSVVGTGYAVDCFNTVDQSVYSDISGVSSASVKNCYNTGNLESKEGLCNGVSGSTATDSYNTGSLNAKMSGIGVCAREAIRCYNTGSITAGLTAAGVSFNATATDCYNTGDLVAGTDAYGISMSTCRNCYNSGNIKAYTAAYGITRGSVFNCYALFNTMTRTQGSSEIVKWYKISSSASAPGCYALDTMTLVYE